MSQPTVDGSTRLAAVPTFRSIGQLAERCGYYCWLEDRLFALTGVWANRPSSTELEAEAQVLCSEMSSWHGFVARQWGDRLPVRAGVDASALVAAPPGPLARALDLVEGEAGLQDAQGARGARSGLVGLSGLVEHILPALLRAYDEDFAYTSMVCEAPVKALLGLVRPRAELEIAWGARLLRVVRGAAGEADRTDVEGIGVGAGLGARLQQVLGTERTIFPAARAS